MTMSGFGDDVFNDEFSVSTGPQTSATAYPAANTTPSVLATTVPDSLVAPAPGSYGAAEAQRSGSYGTGTVPSVVSGVGVGANGGVNEPMTVNLLQADENTIILRDLLQSSRRQERLLERLVDLMERAPAPGGGVVGAVSGGAASGAGQNAQGTSRGHLVQPPGRKQDAPYGQPAQPYGTTTSSLHNGAPQQAAMPGTTNFVAPHSAVSAANPYGAGAYGGNNAPTTSYGNIAPGQHHQQAPNNLYGQPNDLLARQRLEEDRRRQEELARRRQEEDRLRREAEEQRRAEEMKRLEEERKRKEQLEAKTSSLMAGLIQPSGGGGGMFGDEDDALGRNSGGGKKGLFD